MVAACPEDDCKQEKSSLKAQHSVELLGNLLEQVGLQDNLKFCFIAPRNPDEFNAELDKFCQSITASGSEESK